MTLHENICDVLRHEALLATVIATRLMLPLQDVCKAIAELLAAKKIKRAGRVVVHVRNMPRTLDTYTIAAPRPKQDKHAVKMRRLHREFFGGEV